MEFEFSQILIALATYFVATASPGPATLSIMDIAMVKGRKSALIFASGVLCGSFVWALLALFGVAVLLATYANLLYWLKIAGGLYLLWLSYKSLKKINLNKATSNKKQRYKISHTKLFTQGLALHITNPKALFTWLAIVSLALPQNASISLSFIIVSACMLLGIVVFGGYAILFSTPKAQAVYKKLGNWFNGVLTLVFGMAGVKLLTSHS